MCCQDVPNGLTSLQRIHKWLTTPKIGSDKKRFGILHISSVALVICLVGRTSNGIETRLRLTESQLQLKDAIQTIVLYFKVILCLSDSLHAVPIQTIKVKFVSS